MALFFLVFAHTIDFINSYGIKKNETDTYLHVLVWIETFFYVIFELEKHQF